MKAKNDGSYRIFACPVVWLNLAHRLGGVNLGSVYPRQKLICPPDDLQEGGLYVGLYIWRSWWF